MWFMSRIIRGSVPDNIRTGIIRLTKIVLYDIMLSGEYILFKIINLKPLTGGVMISRKRDFLSPSTAGMVVVLVAALFMPVFCISGDAGFMNERHVSIQLNGTDAEVGAFEKEGRIKRLYGQAFSHGSSPEESAEAFLQSNAQLLGVNPEDLKDHHIQPVMFIRDQGEYKFTAVGYHQYKNDIPVFRSQIKLLVRNEENFPLVLASIDLRKLGDFDPPSRGNQLNPTLGTNRVLKMYPSLVHVTEPELVIWAGIDGMDVDPVLAYSFIADNGYQNGDPNPEKYLFITNAVNGEILYEEDLIISTDVVGNVSGRATQGNGSEYCGPEPVEGMPWARVSIGSTVAYADEYGDFVIPNSGSNEVVVESQLRGLWFRVWNEAGTEAVLYDTIIPPGPAEFVHNETNTSEFNRAEVNGYLQSNVVRDFTIKYNPAYPGLQQNEFPVNVNIASSCNAYYDYSSINFYRSGGGCPNTAFSTVVHHEYGHHLVAMAGSGQGAYGEGMGDVMGVLITDDSGLAYGFYGTETNPNCDSPLRDADNTMQYPCIGEIHYCGMLLSGCVWSTRNELIVTEPVEYLDILSNMAVNAMLLHTGSEIDPSITIDYLTLDDDNGNIYDGTPHYWEIAAGFGAHNMDAPELALLGFEFPNGLPELIAPEGGTTLRVVVVGVMSVPQPGTGIMYVNDGSGWIDYPMTEIEPNVYDAVFPAVDCGKTVEYVFSAETTDGDIQYWPMGAPEEVFITVSAISQTLIFADDFNDDHGWTVEDDPGLTTGTWERAIPAGGGDRGDPPTDFDGSGYCFVTDNRNDEDVDDGITWLISPSFDLASAANAKVNYALWYTNDFGNDPNNDLFKIWVSNDNGSNWVLAETIGPLSLSGWNEKEFMIGDHVSLTNTVKVRFEASDLNDGSVVEAGVDKFELTIYHCAAPEVSIEIIPEDPPVTVPPGGSFTYSGILTNNNPTDPQTTDVWIMVGFPGGIERGPALLRSNITIGPGQVLQRDNIQQFVPLSIPPGTYEYIAYCGFYPDIIVDQSSFEVTVTAP